MVKRCFAFFVLRHVFTGDDRYVHNPAPAGFSQERGLLSTVPDTAVVNGQITRIDIKSNFAGIRVIVYEVFFLEE